MAELNRENQAASVRHHVVYWNNIPTPYMVERFDALIRRDNVRFEAWFTERGSIARSWELPEKEWQFQYHFLPALRFFQWKLPFPLRVFFDPKPDLIVMLYSDLPSIMGWLVARALGIKTAFWCQVTPERWVQRRVWKEAVKRYMLCRVDATLGSGEQSRQFTMGYGTPPQRALKLLHAIDGDFFSANSDHARSTERDALRACLGLEGVVFVYVGRLWWGKGINILLEAFSNLQKKSGLAVSLLLLGDGPEEQALRAKCAELAIRNVVFAGFRQKPELPLYYAAADVFVFPTLGDPYGLVVDEAMACALPVIATDAAGEIRDRVTDGMNGYVVPGENAVSMSDAMGRLARDAGLRSRMGAESRKRMQGSSPDRWARDFEAVVGSIIHGAAGGRNERLQSWRKKSI